MARCSLKACLVTQLVGYIETALFEIKLSVVIAYFTLYLTWSTKSHNVCRNIISDDTSGPNNCVISNGYAWKNGYVGANPYVFPKVFKIFYSFNF